MTTTVDDRVVSLTFDNESFERRVGETLDSLDELTKGLQLAGAANGFANVETAAGKVNLAPLKAQADGVSASFANVNESATNIKLDALSQQMQGVSDGFTNIKTAASQLDMSPMANQIDGIASKFTAMGAVAFSVIQNLTNRVIEFAVRGGDAIRGVFDAVLGGGKQRALNIEQAQFLFRGLGIDIEKGMASAKEAVLGTAYGLDAAAKAAAQLGGSGIQVGAEMTGALRGIAGVAGITNSRFEEMADIFTSAAGAGKISGYTLERIAYRGLNAAAALGKQLNLTEAEVRTMASEGKIDFKTFAKAMNDAFGEHATKANQTYSGSLANMHAAMSRLGAQFQLPHLEQQRDLFNSLTPKIDEAGKALKPLIDAFVQMKRITIDGLIKQINGFNFAPIQYAIPFIVEGVQNLFTTFSTLFKIAKKAFHTIFPPSAVPLIVKIAMAFRNFTEAFKIGSDATIKFQRIFNALFSVIKIGFEVVKNIIGLFKALFLVFASATGLSKGGALQFFSDLAIKIIRFKEALVDNGAIDRFFAKLFLVLLVAGQKIGDFIKTVGEFKDKVVKAFAGGGNGVEEGVGQVDAPLTRMQQRFEQLVSLPDRIKDAFEKFKNFFQPVSGALENAFNYIVDWFKNLGGKLAGALGAGDFDQVTDLINVLLLGGIGTAIIAFLKGGQFKEITVLIKTGALFKMGQMIDNLRLTLKAMQMEIQADILMKIAKAIALLSVSLLLLSLIDSEDLSKALIATAAGFGQLVIVMTAFQKLNVGAGIFEAVGLGIALVAIAVAVGILSISIAALAQLSPDQVATGLTAIGVALTILVVALKNMDADKDGMVKSAFAMGLMAGAVILLAGAVRIFANLGADQLAKGLAGVSGGLAAMVIALKNMPENVTGAGAMIAMAIALNILAFAVRQFGEMKGEVVAQGLASIGTALTILVIALKNMEHAVLGAISMVIIAGALVVLAGAVALFGNMDGEVVAQGLTAIGAALLILVLALNGMNSALAGAAALVIVTAALFGLMHVIQTLGSMEGEDIVQGLVSLAAAILLIAGLSVALGAAIGPMLAMAGALILLGGAFFLAGAGVALFAIGMRIMAETGVAGMQAFVDGIGIILAAVPDILRVLLASIVNFLTDFINALPLLIRLLSPVIDSLLQLIIDNVPKLIAALVLILSLVIEGLRILLPQLALAGVDVLLAILEGLRSALPRIAEVAIGLVTSLLDALGNQIKPLIDGIFRFLLKVIEGIGYLIGLQTTAFIPVGKALIMGFIEGLKQNFNLLPDVVKDLFFSIIDTVKSIFGISSPSSVFFDLAKDIIIGMLNGLVETAKFLWEWWYSLPFKILFAIGDLAATFLPKGVELLLGFLTGLIQKWVDVHLWIAGIAFSVLAAIGELLFTLKDKGIALIQGLWNGAIEKFEDIKNWFVGLPALLKEKLTDAATWLLDAGKAIIRGLINGLLSGAKVVGEVVTSLAKGDVIGAFNAATKIFSPSRVFMKAGQQIIAGLVIGLKDSQSASNAAVAVADDVVQHFQKSLAKIPKQLPPLDDLNPVITPVLDLTKIKEGAKDISGLVGANTPTVDVEPNLSNAHANVIASVLKIDNVDATASVPEGPREVTFIQHNHSPKALSTNDIYRKTRSQLALAKEEVGIK